MPRAPASLLLAPVRAIARRPGGVPLLILLGIGALIGLLVATRPTLEPEPQPERVWPVEAVKVSRETIQPRLSLFGEVVAGRRSELRAAVAGRIVAVGPNFREGAQVAAGELLLRIDPFSYESVLAERRAQLREAEAALEQQRRDLVRIRELFAENNASRRDLDNAELGLEQQQALVDLRRIEVQRAARDLADTRLTAPYAGVLGSVSGELGKQLAPNDKVAELIDMGRLEVRFSLSNAQYGRLLEGGETIEGRSVTVTWQVGEQRLSFPATIERVGAQITATTGGVDVYAVLDGPAPRVALRPGAFVSVTVPDRSYGDVFAVPDSALYGDDLVYVVAGEPPEQRLAERRIRVAGYDGTTLLFTPAGEPAVADGDLVVTTQLREIGAGARVVVRPAGD